jgi:hypothetical protein
VGQGEPIDEEFQKSEILNKEFEHEDIEDLSQGFVDWDSPPTYDDDVSEVDLNERPLPSDQEGEYTAYWFTTMFDGLYSKEDDSLEEEEPTDDIANYEEVDENPLGELPNFNDGELGYVNFLDIYNILSDSHNNDCDEFYVDEENYMFTRETMTDPFFRGCLVNPITLPHVIFTLHCSWIKINK